MKTLQRNNRTARRLLKNFFFTIPKKEQELEQTNKEYNEYLNLYRNTTRWQTL